MKVEIKKSGFEKLKKHFPWVYKNEIENIPECNKGDVVDVVYKGEYVATAFFNPLSKITARVISFEDVVIDKKFFKKRIKKAIKKRDFLKNITNSYRLIHSEADFLPGLIVDKYGDYLAISTETIAF